MNRRPTMSLIGYLSPHFERYLTLKRVHPQATYHYKARKLFDLPVIESAFHAQKCRNDSWLYVATPTSSKLSDLAPADHLYVGSQTADRMFRGDGMGGTNFHHAQMRAGNGADTLVAYLRTGYQVDIHRIAAAGLRRAVLGTSALTRLTPLLEQPTQHVGYWFEQFALYEYGRTWRWNTAPVEGRALAVFRGLGL